jgi:hypothetical protein
VRHVGVEGLELAEAFNGALSRLEEASASADSSTGRGSERNRCDSVLGRRACASRESRSNGRNPTRAIQ